jgi:hypothetical protein
MWGAPRCPVPCNTQATSLVAIPWSSYLSHSRRYGSSQVAPTWNSQHLKSNDTSHQCDWFESGNLDSWQDGYRSGYRKTHCTSLASCPTLARSSSSTKLLLCTRHMWLTMKHISTTVIAMTLSPSPRRIGYHVSRGMIRLQRIYNF